MEESFYDQVGGQPFFERLVDAFYEGVARDEILRAMYPDDLVEPRRRLVMFLVQYWGGPSTYLHERGHPRLRLRHAPFHINVAARDAWIRAMDSAMESVRGEISDVQFAELDTYFDMVARQLRNA